MDSAHNPDRYMADLRQILSQGRKRIGLLVGAGAPLSIRIDSAGKISTAGAPLIPGVDELTKQVIGSLAGKELDVVRGIHSDLGANANIETVLSRVRLLQQAIGASKINDIDGPGYGSIAKRMCEKIGELVGSKLPSERNSYHELVSWISGTSRSSAVEIFTTNYDLLFEEAFESARVPYFDGFSGGASPFFDPVSVSGDDLPPRWSRLWKMHGSLGWKLEGNTVVRSGGREASQMVYPDHLKYDLTQKQPYSALFERLKSFLLTPDTLLIATGFSFRDAHICAVIDETLAMNSNAAVFAFQYQSLEKEECAKALALDRPNLSVYASDGAVINSIAGKWRPGELAKGWEEIRKSYWEQWTPSGPYSFSLGDFSKLARFCALAQSADIVADPIAGTTVPAAGSGAAS